MKKIGLLTLACVTLLLSSCVVSHTVIVTNNPVGTKKGVVSGTPFKKNLDLSYMAAKKRGKITKVGIAEFKTTNILIIPKYEANLG